jgi:hypothetical protein
MAVAPSLLTVMEYVTVPPTIVVDVLADLVMDKSCAFRKNPENIKNIKSKNFEKTGFISVVFLSNEYGYNVASILTTILRPCLKDNLNHIKILKDCANIETLPQIHYSRNKKDRQNANNQSNK